MRRIWIAFLLLVLGLPAVLVAACRDRQPAAPLPVPAVSTPIAATAVPTSTPTAVPDFLNVTLDDAIPLDAFPTDAPLTLRFNQPMRVDPADAADPLRLSPRTASVLSWSADFTTLTFTPAGRWRSGQSYRLALDGALQSRSGLVFDEAPTWRFKTLPAPQVVRRTPNVTTLTERRPTIALKFNHPMRAASVAQALQVEPPLAHALTWEADDTLQLALTEPLAFDTLYTFTLAPTAVDAAGTPLARSYTWTLTLKPLLAGVSGPTAQDPGAPVTLRFNYPIDDASLSGALRIEPAVRGKLAWNDDYTTATLTPDAQLPPDTSYTLRFTQPLRARSGDALPAPPPAQFTTPPPVLAFTPQGREVDPTAPITVRFDRPMDQPAAEAAFSITPAVAGAFTWRETTLIFSPADGILDENESYTVAIGPGAVGARGEQLFNASFDWSFTTMRFAPVADFGDGPNAQVLDADGRRAIQFRANTRQPRAVTFELYSLSPAQFLDRYASGFRGSAGWGGQARPAVSTAGTELRYSWQTETAAPRQEWLNVQETLVPAEVPPGLYLLNMVAGRLTDQLILVLTDSAIVVKEAGGELLVWVTTMNGDARSGAPVSVYARSGDRLAGGQADENGLFRVKLPPFAAGGPPAIEPLIVVAGEAAAGDTAAATGALTVSGLAPEWRSGWGYRDWWDPRPQNAQSAVFITTDRPIYKPGQPVYYKAIVRLDDDAELSLPPAGTAVTVRIRDARNNVVETTQLAANDFGSVHGRFQLAEGAMLGRYHVEVEVAGAVHKQLFKVEDYRKPDYQVTVTAASDSIVRGETLSFTVDARYFFGEPVANAAVEVRRFWLSQDWYGGGYSWYEDYDSHSRIIRGVTDEDGRFRFTIDTGHEPLYFDDSRNWESSLTRLTWGVEATVDDGSRQATSGFAIVHVYNAAESVTLDSGSYVQTPGRPFTVRAAVNTIRDEPVAGRALELQLRRWSHSTYDYTQVVQRARFTTGADGRAALAFTIAEPGFYQLRAVGTDARGNAISYTSYVYAFSDAFDRWNGRVNDNELRVDADAASYAPGDAARILIESSFSGPALLTVERGRVRRAQLIRLEAPLTVVELPIEDGDAPNVYVVVNAWRAQDTQIQEHTSSSLPDGRLLMAHVNLSVPPVARQLTVNITPDKEIYAPREEATFTVRVTNYRGEPVSAEVALAVVDEAIYALSEELTGPMLDAFYYERPSNVYTYDSLYPTRWLWAGGMGGGGDGGALAGGPRSDFPDTAAWFPLLTTDWNGEATVTITLPDSLTSWRLTAKAVTADTQVGEGVANVLTQQPVVVRPILPRALTVGDRAQLSALVHNYSAAAQALTVTLAEPSTTSLLEMLTPAAQTVALAPGEVRMVGWGVRAVAPGSAELLVTAAPTADPQAIADAVQLPLTVQPLAVPDVSTQVGQFSGRFATTIDFPADALPQSAVEVQLSRSIAGSLLEGLEYLTGYPYGCVEQTMSKALPNAVVGRALFQLGVSNPTLQAELPAQIGASVQRLYGYQHNDGGWGWWYDDPSHDYQTAWVLFGLAQVAQAGYEVDAAVIERGADWLNANLAQMDPRTRAFALYALATAEQPNADAARALAQNLNSLDGDVFSLAGLALALDAVGERGAARAILDELAETAVVRDDGMVYWTGANDDGYYDKTMASETRSTALALSAFSRIAPGHALESGMVRWLMAQRRTQGWGTTNETAFALLGLTDHLLATSFSAAAAPATVTLLLNGAPLATAELSRGTPSATFTVPADQLRVGRNVLEVTHTGSGQLYYVINGRMLLARAEIEAAGVIDVRRSYLDGVTGEPLARIQAGQLVRVQLTLNVPDAGAYMIIEDRLPGGLEALNEGLNNTSHVATAYEDRYQWRELGYNYKEIFGDRVSFFITEVGRGRRTLTYYARATHSGEFTALPAEAYGMYNLALWGRSASDRVVVAYGYR